MENVRCEELQIELSAAMRTKPSQVLPSSTTYGGGTSSYGLSSVTSAATSVTWAPTPSDQPTEIDKIMAKIEQARLSIANVCVNWQHFNTNSIILIFI